MYSSDFAEPLTLPSLMDSAPSTSDSVMGATPLDPNSPPEESISILTSMGFPRTHSINALKATVSLPPDIFFPADVFVSLSWSLMFTAGALRQSFHPLPICCHVTKGGSFMIKLDVEMKSERAGRHDDGQTAVINELGWPTC